MKIGDKVLITNWNSSYHGERGFIRKIWGGLANFNLVVVGFPNNDPEDGEHTAEFSENDLEVFQ